MQRTIIARTAVAAPLTGGAANSVAVTRHRRTAPRRNAAPSSNAVRRAVRLALSIPAFSSGWLIGDLLLGKGLPF